MKPLIALLPALFLGAPVLAGCEFTVRKVETIGNVFGEPREMGAWTVVAGGEVVAEIVRSPVAPDSPPPRVERCPPGRGRAWIVPRGLARGNIHHDDQRAELVASLAPHAIAQADYEGDFIRLRLPHDVPADLAIVATTFGTTDDPDRPPPIIGLHVYPLTVLEAHSAEAEAFVLFRDAFLALSRGDASQAQRLSKALVALRPRSAWARSLASDCAAAAGDRKSAIAHVKKAVLILRKGDSDDMTALDSRRRASLLESCEERHRILIDGSLQAELPGRKRTRSR